MKKKSSFTNRFGLLIIIFVVIISTIFTFNTLNNIEKTSNLIISESINLNLFILFLCVIIFLVKLFINLKELQYSLLYRRIAILFSILTILPTLILFLFALLLFNYGVQTWFNEKINSALKSSNEVAKEYLREHAKNLGSEAMAMESDLSSEINHLNESNMLNIESLNKIITIQSEKRGLEEVLIINLRRDIIAKNRLSFAINFENISDKLIQNVKNNEMIIFTNDYGDRVRALIKINALRDQYLIIGKMIENKIIDFIDSTQNAGRSYNILRSNIKKIQLQFCLLFILLSLFLLLFSVWLGLRFAKNLIRPIIELAGVVEMIKDGNLDVKITELKERNEISLLQKGFNLMIRELKNIHHRLILKNEEIDQRRIFIEKIISNLSSGIIVLNERKDAIILCNQSFYEIFQLNKRPINNINYLSSISSEIFRELENNNTDFTKKIKLKNGKVILCKISYIFDKKQHIVNSIISFDDISNLLKAQEAIAWSEIMKRVAHEIKNPITPIYLATEKLEENINKKNIEKSTIVKYCKIIKRNINQIQFVINEFANFSNINLIRFKKINICNLIKESCASIKLEEKDKIKYKFDFNKDYIKIACDQMQMACVFDNIFKNSIESILSNNTKSGYILIKIVYDENKDYLIITIEDNGSGFPEEMIDLISQPHITTKKTGFGLGLNIAKKIIKGHKGEIYFSNHTNGAKIKIKLPILYIA